MGTKARQSEAIQVAFSFDNGADERVPSAVVVQAPKARAPRTPRAAANVTDVQPVPALAKQAKDVAERKPRASARSKNVVAPVVEAIAPVAQPKANAAPKAPERVARPPKVKPVVRAKPEEAHVPAPPVQPTPRKQRGVQPQQTTADSASVVEANAKASVAQPRARKGASDAVNTPPANEHVAQSTPTARKKATTEEALSKAASTPPRAPRERASPKEQEPSNEITFGGANTPGTTPREVPAGPMFLMSYDDSPKRTVAEKIEAAMVAYQTRFARRPNLVLVNANVASEVEVPDVAIERRSTVPPNNFWAGMQIAPRVVAVAE